MHSFFCLNEYSFFLLLLQFLYDFHVHYWLPWISKFWGQKENRSIFASEPYSFLYTFEKQPICKYKRERFNYTNHFYFLPSSFSIFLLWFIIFNLLMWICQGIHKLLGELRPPGKSEVTKSGGLSSLKSLCMPWHQRYTKKVLRERTELKHLPLITLTPV